VVVTLQVMVNLVTVFPHVRQLGVAKANPAMKSMH